MTKSVLMGALGGIILTLAGIALALTFFGEGDVLRGIQTIGSLAIAFSAMVAYRFFKVNISRHAKEDRRAESKAFLDESIALLNRAYETFTRFGDHPPKNDRLLWLSTARMIVRFQNMRKQITEKDHQAIVDENEEYIRLKFSTLLDACKDELTVDYFIPGNFPNESRMVPRNSVAVIFDFAKWREDMTDPLDQVDDKELLARGAIPIDFLGVENFLGYYKK